MNSWKAFSESCWLWKHFPCKKLSSCLKKCSRLVRGWENMVDEAKFHSPMPSTFEGLVVWPVVWCCHGEKLDPFYWPMLSAGFVFVASHGFLLHLMGLLSILLRCSGFTGILKVVVDQTGSRLPSTDLFWCKFAFRKCFGAPSQSNHWTDHRQLSYKIDFSSYITIWLRNGCWVE